MLEVICYISEYFHLVPFRVARVLSLLPCRGNHLVADIKMMPLLSWGDICCDSPPSPTATQVPPPFNLTDWKQMRSTHFCLWLFMKSWVRASFLEIFLRLWTGGQTSLATTGGQRSLSGLESHQVSGESSFSNISPVSKEATSRSAVPWRAGPD